MFETSGPSFIECIRDAWQLGGRKYFFHNLSCQLRQGRYTDCYNYKNTWWDNVLFSLGVFTMDPFGRRYFKRLVINKESMFERQWLRHPMPWVRFKAKRNLDDYSSNSK